MIDKLFSLNQKPHASIFVEAKFSDLNQLIKKYLKSIVCTKNPYCNECIWCNEIDNNSYMDLIVYNGYNQTIKKEDILNIKEQFSHSSIEEPNKKFYVLIGIENSTKEALNALLKFIEEPLNDTYCILTTRNISKVLPTIISRCHVYYLNSNYKEFNNQIKQFNLSQEEQLIAKELFYSADEFKSSIESNEFYSICNFAFNFIKYKNNPTKIKDLYLEFKQMEYSYIKKIIIAIKALNIDYAKSLTDLLNKINLYLNKSLIFNKIWDIITCE